MTELAVSLDSKKKARIFTDTASLNMSGKVEYCKKVYQIGETGVFIAGRGASRTIDLVVKTATSMNLGGFDDYLPHWFTILQHAWKKAFLESSKLPDLPRNETVGSTIDFFIKHDKRFGSFLQLEVYVLGFSKKHGRIACSFFQLIKGSFNSFNFLKTPFPLFTRSDIVQAYFSRKSRIPKSDKDIIEGMRLSRAGVGQTFGGNFPEIETSPLFKIRKYTINEKGKCTMQSMGPFWNNKKQRDSFVDLTKRMKMFIPG